MEQVLNFLNKIDRRLENIESQVFKQNDKINCLEKSLKLIQMKNRSESDDSGVKSTNHSLTGKDSFIKHVISEMTLVGNGKKGNGEQHSMTCQFQNVNAGEEKVGSKLKKNNSFNGKASPKPAFTRRSPHTVPSDKDEERRLNKFFRECLSKAIQWSFVELLNAAVEITDDELCPKWLDKEDAKLVMKGADQKDKFRRFLCVLRKKEYVVMQEWLHNCGLDDTVLKRVWSLFDEFSDKDTNNSKLKCFHCRLVQGVSVTDISDYLYSADILTSEKNFLERASSKRPIGAQDDLWKFVLRECQNYICPEVVAVAFKAALMEQLELAGDNKKLIYESLLSDIDICKPEELLSCSCVMRCSQSLHPPSCLKSLSLAGLYFSPPTRRKQERSSSSSEAPQSSSSSNSSLDSPIELKVAERGDTSSPNDETELKKPYNSANDDKMPDGSTDVSKYMFKTQRSRSRSLRRKRSQTRAEKVQSDSIVENNDGHNKKVSPNRYSYKSNTNKLNENKACIIPVNARTVYIDTGTRNIQLHRNGRSSESSVEV